MARLSLTHRQTERQTDRQKHTHTHPDTPRHTHTHAHKRTKRTHMHTHTRALMRTHTHAPKHPLTHSAWQWDPCCHSRKTDGDSHGVGIDVGAVARTGKDPHPVQSDPRGIQNGISEPVSLRSFSTSTSPSALSFSHRNHSDEDHGYHHQKHINYSTD